MRPQVLIPAALVLLGGCTASRPQTGDAAEARIARVGSGLRRAVQVKGAAVEGFLLPDRMARYHTPGVTIAVADSGRIVWPGRTGSRKRLPVTR